MTLYTVRGIRRGNKTGVSAGGDAKEGSGTGRAGEGGQEE